MNLEIQGVEGEGNLERERLVLKATEKLDAGDFAVFVCRAGTAKREPLAGPIELGYWFGELLLNKNDYVVLYTKQGQRAEKKNSDGSVSHFLYWRRTAPIWSEQRVAVVIETGEWDYKSDDDATLEPPPKSTRTG